MAGNGLPSVITPRTRSGINGELARVETAKAPADERDLAAARVVQLLHQIDHCVLHTVGQSEIAALTPAAHGIATALQSRP